MIPLFNKTDTGTASSVARQKNKHVNAVPAVINMGRKSGVAAVPHLPEVGNPYKVLLKVSQTNVRRHFFTEPLYGIVCHLQLLMCCAVS